MKAVKHYDQFSTHLGDGLEEEFRYALDQLSRFPLSMPIVKGNLRKRPLFRFPYTIFYRVMGRNVEILAFVHQRRGPEYLTERLAKADDDAGRFLE